MARETLGSCGGEGKPSKAPRDVGNVIAVFRKLVVLGASLKRLRRSAMCSRVRLLAIVPLRKFSFAL